MEIIDNLVRKYRGEGSKKRIREAWEGMNSVLGKRVIIINPLNNPEWRDPNVLERRGGERYVLTPDEVRKFGCEIQIGHERYANVDPTRSEAIELVINVPIHIEKLRSSYHRYDNQPWYCLARPKKFEDEEVQVWIDDTRFFDNSQVPMHLLDESCGVPIICYDYHIHSRYLTYGCSDNEGLLKRMAEAGMKSE
ncbi:hypothetical protein GOV12_06010 [Candidatus Pacearchaeota archaeon]|nr:hypothetical protein [Candidatus Pacearchaeota archaeon]